MMTALIDLTGQKFSRLTVIEATPSKRGGRLWHCKCDCGLESIVRGRDIKKGNIRSCGCLRREIAKDLSRLNIIHGAAGSKTYKVWVGMRGRCSNPKYRHFKCYGGRGITVCQRWNSFARFLKDMGYPKSGQTLDRINNNGNYSPENCRWASRKQQANNRRTTRLLTFYNKTMSLSAWSMEMGLSKCAVGARLKAGWSIKRALAPSKSSVITESNRISEEVEN